MLKRLRKGEIRLTSIKLAKFNDLKAEAGNRFLIGRVHWPFAGHKVCLVIFIWKSSIFSQPILYINIALYYTMLCCIMDYFLPMRINQIIVQLFHREMRATKLLMHTNPFKIGVIWCNCNNYNYIINFRMINCPLGKHKQFKIKHHWTSRHCAQSNYFFGITILLSHNLFAFF